MVTQLTIKETIDNMVDELGRAKDIISRFNQAEYVDDLEVCEVCDDINRTLIDELQFFKERLDLAMLMASAKGDIAIPTVNELFKAEPTYELPINEDGVIDTEMVYNTVEEFVEKI